MQLQFERHHDSILVPGFRYEVRRISLARRMKFLAENHDLIQELKFLSAAPDQTAQQRLEIAQLELELSRKLLEECLVSVSGGDEIETLSPERMEWLISRAPAGLCVEILVRISEELALSEHRRKN